MRVLRINKEQLSEILFDFVTLPEGAFKKKYPKQVKFFSGKRKTPRFLKETKLNQTLFNAMLKDIKK